MEEILERLQHTFKEKYGETPTNTYFSPGRVNLIGEHIDYNGGHVFPCAITQGTYGVVRKREDHIVRCYSLNFPEFDPVEFNIKDIVFDKADKWVEYVKGMVHLTLGAGYEMDSGFDLVIYGNIPNASGLSSSASLELLIGVLLDDLYDLTIDRLDLVKMGQRVENEIIGVNSGIMDQFAVAMGKEDMAIYLNTENLEYELVPANFKENVILIMNTNKRRELASSKYNQRRQECEQALAVLQKEMDIQALGELTVNQFEKVKHLLTDKTLLRRARHVVTENERVSDTISVLKENNLERFGELLKESHTSLKEDYDVTGIELDTLVDAASSQPGVLGARMTGAGMGGCAIALVDVESVEQVIDAVQSIYQEKIGYEASFYVAQVGDGAKVIN